MGTLASRGSPSGEAEVGAGETEMEDMEGCQVGLLLGVEGLLGGHLGGDLLARVLGLFLRVGWG